MSATVSGVEPGQRRLNGPQTTGRIYRNLSPAEHTMTRRDDVEVPMRDGVTLLADVYRPDGPGPFPVLVSASCYPRQIQDSGAPMGFVEAGASDFFVPRGYVHVIANLRGTGGSGGTFGFFDRTEREDMHDLVEWAGTQEWSNGNVGMVGISYFAMTQLEAATQQPSHLKAIFPVAVTADLYEIAWHHGLFNSSFMTSWLTAVAVSSGHGDALWRGTIASALRRVLAVPQLHARFEQLNGEAAMSSLRSALRAGYEPHPWDDLRFAVSVEHPTRDAFWDERNLLPLLADVTVPVYLGCDWDNAPVHLPSTFSTLSALADNPHVRVAMVGTHGLSWPWESLHVEALAWFDHWLKGADTGIIDGPPIRYVVEGGDDEWHTTCTWPPAESTLTDYALRADATLGVDEGEAGSRDYLCLTERFAQAPNANRPELPALLSWDTTPLPADLDVVGNIELVLDAAITDVDASWNVTLHDVDGTGRTTTVTTVSAGWLRASLRQVDDRASRPGAPVLGCRAPVAVPPGETVAYRIPIVPNAHRFAAGHQIRLTINSDDQPKDAPTALGFRHPAVSPALRASIHSSSRLRLPLISRP